MELFKGSIIILYILLVSNPHRAIKRPQPAIHPKSWLIPIVTWCHQICSLATNNLLHKSNLKFQSRASAACVAISPNYLGGKYRNRLHPRSRKCACHFFVRQSVWNWTASDWHYLFGDNNAGHAMCFKAECLMPTVLSLKWQVLNNCDISVLQQVGVFLPGWWRFGLCSSGSSHVFWWRDASLMHKFQITIMLWY